MITGGAGFIGSHVVRLFVTNYPEYEIYNLDDLTYAGNLENLTDVESRPNYHFLKGDIVDRDFVSNLFDHYGFDFVIHLAAESHVDRSIKEPLSFVYTNVVGTVNLLNQCLKHWRMDAGDNFFYHVSTDEVYGSLSAEGYFVEDSPYDPQSPYAASKASSDHFVRAYGNTYGLPFKISNCSNNYGANQFPEKLIPLMINNIRLGKPLPVYGKGENVRDWLYVVDHAKAIDKVFHRGKKGETYNIGGANEWRNIDLVGLLCDLMDKKLGQDKGTSRQLITYVKDRAGHDLRYAIDAGKIQRELGWKPSVTFEEGIELTIGWYLGNQTWLDHVTSGEYQNYYRSHYEIKD